MIFSNQVIWITGASSGIGEAMATAFSREGASVVLSARRVDRLEATRLACSHPDRHLILPLDVALEATHQHAYQTILDRFGRVDILINNSGIGQRSLVMNTELSVERRIMEVNYFGTLSLTHTVLPDMVKRGSGQIVVISSLMGKLFTPRRSSYAASKHALQGYFESLHSELRNSGVSVTMVLPGYVKTEIPIHSLKGDGQTHEYMDKTNINGISADRCAGKIVRAVRKKRADVYIGGPEVLTVFLFRYFPRLYRTLLGMVYRRGKLLR